MSVAAGVLALIAAAIACGVEETSAQTVRVGVYDNPPKVEMGPGGRPRGIFIDLLEHVAESEGWEVEYVHCTWDEALSRIARGEIDLMPDVAYSEGRDGQLDFNRLAVLSSWLQVFTRQDARIRSVADLDGKTVAVLKGSIQQTVVDELRERFGLSLNLVAHPDYEATIGHVESGRADAAIVSRFYGYNRKKRGGVRPTPVILHPTVLLFATADGRNAHLLDAIDRHLAQAMNDPHSVYYRSLAYWLQEKPRTFLPAAVLWGIIAILAILLFFLILSAVLRWQVNRRTAELREKNEALFGALQELERARDEALRRERLHAFCQLASGAAHDFNNLLVPIVACTDLMLDEPGALANTGNARQRLEVIRTAARHGTEIVNRMQQFYRSTEHRDAKGSVDISAVVREVVELGGQRLKGTGLTRKAPIEIALNLGGNCDVDGWKTDIHEMLLNLVFNAADAMPDGGRLGISTENAGGAVRITVSDTGAGMSGEVLERCLQPFFTTKGAMGTGMGLTMVNNIVAAHGGTLEISSTVGKGTTFTMTFPKGAPEQPGEQHGHA